MSFTWPDILTRLVEGHDLAADETLWAMTEILSDNATSAQMSAFMVALRAKGETVTELRSLADGMLEMAPDVDLPREAVDVVGSGGDRANTVNVSTMAAIVAAASGAKVIKHGNRAASSMCGTADCLEELGLNLNPSAQLQQRSYDECGIVFLFAPIYHGSLRHIAPTRREVGIQTTFNYLGPLSNPARPHAQAIGIANVGLADLVAGVLAQRGNRGLVFHGGDGLDELTTTTTSQLWLINDGEVKPDRLDPRELGFELADPSQLVGGAPDHNADVVRRVFAGETGPVRDIVALNAAAAILAFDGPTFDDPAVEQVAAAMSRAVDAIDSGKAAALLDRWIELSHSAD